MERQNLEFDTEDKTMKSGEMMEKIKVKLEFEPLNSAYCT